ncbi:MAG: 30S ribosomal protein S12 methylthiotransferase RimO, partial [Candidatus Omnitrophica bacterium CG10_big_fil_rev_8_21_14_0_10_43_8]
MKTVAMLSLGCPKNLVDSEGILADFVKKGYKVIDEAVKADVAIVNTCAFIEDAKRESIDTILDLIELKKQGRIKKIIVAGCLPERYKKVLRKEMAEIDIFSGVRKFSKSDPDDRLLITPSHYAYIKISEGCDNRCSYCVISKIRGPYKSRGMQAILKEINDIRERSNGKLKEINLISQDLTYYGMDLYGKLSLASLLRRINKDIKWVRLLYAHPAHFNDELIDIIKNSAHICKYVDLPVQHISDKLLKSMGRKITKKQILDLITKLRKNIPDIAIRSSLIVGLPGETEKEFKELLGFIKDIKFERLGIFTYSREEDTPAYSFKGQVSDKEKRLRLDEAMKLQQD